MNTPLSNPAVRNVLVRPNSWRECLNQYWSFLEAIRTAGGVRAICCSSNYAGENPPWIEQPRTGRRFQEPGSIIVGSMVEGTDYTVSSFEVPSGMDGVLKAHFQMFTGAGFTEGSGDIIWRIRINRAFVKDYSNTLTSYGNTTSPVPFNNGQIRLSSRDTVSYIAQLGAGALTRLDNTARIVVATLGYYYPQE
jgi:hypothetical protein